VTNALLETKYTELVCPCVLTGGTTALSNQIGQGNMFLEAILRRIKSVVKKIV
jgi:hypothetical protein